MSTTATPAQHSVLLVPMPIPRTPHAPHFNGKYVTDFLTLIAQHGANTGITNMDDMVPYILHVKDMIRYDAAFDPEVVGKTWTNAKDALKVLFGHADKAPEYTEAMLQDFCREQNAKSPFSNKEEIEAYTQKFAQIAGPLTKKKKITAEERDFYFITGISNKLKDWFNDQVPVANRTRTAPPTIPDSVAILQKRFDTNSLTYVPWAETSKSKPRVPTFGADGNKQETTYLRQDSDPDHGAVTDQMDDINRKLELLHLSIAKLSSNRAPEHSHATEHVHSDQVHGPQKSCFMCGKVNAHPLHPSRCPETRFLLDSNTIKFDTNTERYVMKDGTDLPRIPRGFVGGVAEYIRARERDQAQASTTARTNSIRLSYESNRVLNDDYFAVSSLDIMDRLAEPVTRTGRDTNVRFDPTKRTEGNKGKEREREAAQPSTSAPAPAPAPAPPVKPPVTAFPTLPNPINREDGWRNSRPSNSNPRNEDITMRDAKRQVS
ncbi:hypothetical protein B0H16DRAFT_1471259 [Mycena metata]|uniref:DUF4100 domain-containing protein n=1 Tax=Mycena metata TaxID=1033252 RepID=A0AAD7HT46_9AGAR|nr:hypothetical protein B0H16DRAFT_1471259 [Mycena metata]